MAASNNIMVLTNCGTAKEARRIARSLVEKRLAACVNLLTAPVESVYRWKGKLETAKEITLLIKTTRARYVAVERAIRKLHSYEVPEIIAIPITGGSRDYLTWLGECVARLK